MGDENSGASGAERLAGATEEVSEPVPDEGSDGLPSRVTEFAWGDPEQFYESFFAHLEAEAKGIRGDRQREPGV
ncbi:hypothetical protein PHK61_31600 [Actinomycetospora lutea]|uniref:hypothetical protein n=1 Tax=Actinomycetospora lutea TaxID=663604 RepID=UPI002365B561|nr:hypothetical protein [Actinomycetospora lutea]MDD7942961.1 hypothetical protein [Actinomycetospora lutea]